MYNLAKKQEPWTRNEYSKKRYFFF